MTMPMKAEAAFFFRASGLALALLAGGCGSDGGQPLAPTPATPAPAPPAEPPPPPVVTPPVSEPVGPLIAEVAPGGRLEGDYACARTRDSYSGYRLAGVELLGRATIGDFASPAFAMDYLNDNQFQINFNGFGGSNYRPSDRGTASSRAYAGSYFVDNGPFPNPYDEFELHRNSTEILRFATLGRNSYSGMLCFFSAGAVSDQWLLVDGRYEFTGIADGLLVGSGGTRRLFGSVVKAVLDANGKALLVTIDLSARNQPFGEFLDQPATSIGQATARFSYNRSSLGMAPLSGPDGATGSIRGGFFKGNLGLGFVFELEYPNGDRILGAAGLDIDT